MPVIDFFVADKLKNDSQPRLEPFSPGQVYNGSKGKQVHVITAVNEALSNLHLP